MLFPDRRGFLGYQHSIFDYTLWTVEAETFFKSKEQPASIKIYKF